MSNTGRMYSLLILIAVVATVAIQPAEAESPDGLALICYPGSDATRLKCEFRNETSEEVVILASPFALEGPLGDPKYVYFYVGGARKENTLEFGYPRVENLGGPIQLKPTVRLTDDDLPHLCRISKGASVSIEIELADAMDHFLGSDVWLFRAKVIAARDSRLSELTLSDACMTSLGDAITKLCPNEILAGTESRSRAEKKPRNDCLDVISFKFDHVFSADFEAAPGVVKKQGQAREPQSVSGENS